MYCVCVRTCVLERKRSQTSLSTTSIDFKYISRLSICKTRRGRSALWFLYPNWTCTSQFLGESARYIVHLASNKCWRRGIGEVCGGGLSPPPKPLIMDSIFFQNGISTWHLLYTVIHNHLKIYYFRYLSGMLKDWIHWNVPTSIAYRLQSYSLRAYCQNTKSYFEKSCFEQKNAWSRFTSILFILHEIW